MIRMLAVLDRDFKITLLLEDLMEKVYTIHKSKMNLTR